MSNDSPFAHRVARTTRAPSPGSGSVRLEADSPFSHSVSKSAPPEKIAPMPLLQDDLACEEEFAPEPARPTTIAPAPVAQAVPTTAEPVVVAAPKESALRQTLLAVAAFVVTTIVLIGAAVAWKLLFAAK